jgi:hypothetical protein
MTLSKATITVLQTEVPNLLAQIEHNTICQEVKEFVCFLTGQDNPKGFHHKPMSSVTTLSPPSCYIFLNCTKQADWLYLLIMVWNPIMPNWKPKSQLLIKKNTSFKGTKKLLQIPIHCQWFISWMKISNVNYTKQPKEANEALPLSGNLICWS